MGLPATDLLAAQQLTLYPSVWLSGTLHILPRPFEPPHVNLHVGLHAVPRTPCTG